MSNAACESENYAMLPLTLLKQKKNNGGTKKRVVVIAGPTCVGKTAISIIIASVIGGEIISADSAQAYRGMNIGTAKVTLEEQKNIKHHLIDCRDIDEPFHVIDFCREANQALREIFARNHVPIIVGGTGFYIHSLIYGPPLTPPCNAEIRKKLEEEMERFGPLLMLERLKRLDPEYALVVTLNDKRKIIRALEVIAITNQGISSFKRESVPLENLDFRCWFIHKPKETLYSLINQRCETMIAKGFIEEVVKLKEQGLEKNPSAARSIGYRQCLNFFTTPQSQEDLLYFIKEFKKASRHYAKRQYTWFRKEPLFRWLDIHKLKMENVIEIIIQDYEQNLSF
jgi:tRNA dimethylallyltransferase